MLHSYDPYNLPTPNYKTAVLIDGGFYRIRAKHLFGEKTPKQRAAEIYHYAARHAHDHRTNTNSLFRIFYYDCPPSEKTVTHPLTNRQIRLGITTQYKWMTEFLKELALVPKTAIRRGETLETQSAYKLKPDILKKLCAKKITIDDLTENDFRLEISQKGVDMRLGLDISSLSKEKIVDRIVVISGDSDLIPAAKLARRNGVDFIVDSLGMKINAEFREQVDVSIVQRVFPESYEEALRNEDNLKDILHIENLMSHPELVAELIPSLL